MIKWQKKAKQLTGKKSELKVVFYKFNTKFNALFHI